MEKKKDAVIVLDTDGAVVSRAGSAFRQFVPETLIVELNFNSFLRWTNIFQEWADINAEVRLLFVDPAHVPGFNLANNHGIEFLEEFKKAYPSVLIFLFNDTFLLSELQIILEKRLINHFEVKKKSRLGDSDYWHSLAEKVRQMVIGDFVGNVQNPDRFNSGETFRHFFRVWIDSMPEGGETIIPGFDGKPIRTQQILDDPVIFRQFTQVIQSGRLDQRVREALKLAGQGKT